MQAKITTIRRIPKILMGVGAVGEVGKEVTGLGAKRALLISDPGVMKAGIVERVLSSLKGAKVKVSVFDRVEPDPRYEIVDECAEWARPQGIQCVIGVGGGSSLDVAKAVAVMLKGEGSISSFFGVELIHRPGVPVVAVPTTAGTGSEVTPIVILSDEGEKLKKGVVSLHLIPSVAILDPELTVGMPPSVTAATGMDALIHAIEAFTSINATPFTDLLAARAMELLYSNIRKAYCNGSDIRARSHMLEGSLLAGIAFANAGVTAVHAFAYPIGAEFHIPHGIANTLMLPRVMEFNMIGALERFASIATMLGEAPAGLSLRETAQRAVMAMERLREDLGLPSHLSDFGVTAEDIPRLASGVLKVTRLLANNPRTVTQKDAEEIYRRSL
jgi:alcohol dehydrogenase class IV